MTLLFHDPFLLKHAPNKTHPEHPDRLRATWSALVHRGVAGRCELGRIRPATRDQILAVHREPMIAFAEDLCRQGGGYLEADTPVGPSSVDVALLAAGACVGAVDAVLTGVDKTAFCLVRPPGHHATPTQSMGFCLFNNIAVAVHRAIQEHRLERILVVDWDVHHGNGTQDVFYDDPRVMFFSVHRYPFYPGTGSDSESGVGDGLGFTRNVPLPASSTAQTVLERFTSALEDCARRSRPQIVFLSAGFDAHHLDPIGGLNLDREQFQAMLACIVDVARQYANGRVISLLEGGYNIHILADCVCDHVNGLLLAEQA